MKQQIISFVNAARRLTGKSDVKISVRNSYVHVDFKKQWLSGSIVRDLCEFGRGDFWIENSEYGLRVVFCIKDNEVPTLAELL